MKAIVLDLDGTLCDFYNVNGWLSMLQAENAAPYLIAKPLGDYKKLNGLLAALQGYGYAVEVVSWLAKGETSKQFDSAVRKNKRAWLRKYYPAINLKNVHVVKHGTNKWRVSNYKGGILFDDESGNVNAWKRDTMSGKAVRIKDETTLLDALESLIIQELEQIREAATLPFFVMFHVTRKRAKGETLKPSNHSWRRFYHNVQPKAREKLKKFFYFLACGISQKCYTNLSREDNGTEHSLLIMTYTFSTVRYLELAMVNFGKLTKVNKNILE